MRKPPSVRFMTRSTTRTCTVRSCGFCRIRRPTTPNGEMVVQRPISPKTTSTNTLLLRPPTRSSPIWSTVYNAINRANAVISRVPGITMDNDLKDRYIAEAKFMRGFYYFTLVRLFGAVPIITTETTSLNDLSVARASVDDVYKLVIQDFTEAESVLPTTYSTADKGRATKGAAKAFLAKVYLTRQDWVKASAKAKEVIDLGAYDLWASFADAFLIANKNGKEGRLRNAGFEWRF
jgi:hypothetical protein